MSSGRSTMETSAREWPAAVADCKVQTRGLAPPAVAAQCNKLTRSDPLSRLFEQGFVVAIKAHITIAMINNINKR